MRTLVLKNKNLIYVLCSELKTPFFVPSPTNWRADARSGGQKRRSRDWSHAQDAKHLSMAKPHLLTGVSAAARWSGDGMSLPDVCSHAGSPAGHQNQSDCIVT